MWLKIFGIAGEKVFALISSSEPESHPWQPHPSYLAPTTHTLHTLSHTLPHTHRHADIPNQHLNRGFFLCLEPKLLTEKETENQ